MPDFDSSKLNPGDEVAYYNCYGPNMVPHICHVERLTKSGRVVIKEHNSTQFYKDGTMVGGRSIIGLSVPRIVFVTPKVHKDIKRNRQINTICDTRFEKLSDEKIEAIYSIICDERESEKGIQR